MNEKLLLTLIVQYNVFTYVHNIYVRTEFFFNENFFSSSLSIFLKNTPRKCILNFCSQLLRIEQYEEMMSI